MLFYSYQTVNKYISNTGRNLKQMYIFCSVSSAEWLDIVFTQNIYSFVEFQMGQKTKTSNIFIISA